MNHEPKPEITPDFYFSLKAYSKGEGNLKFELDFANPFSTVQEPQKPKIYIDAESIDKFDKIISFIKEIYTLIAKEGKDKEFAEKEGYKAQIDNLRDMFQKSKEHGGGISRILFEQHNPRALTVSMDATVVGNGDLRPPKY